MRFSQMFKKNIQQQMSKESLNKYKKKTNQKERPQNYQKLATQSTTKNQFQKYFLDTVNVFFEDRQTLKNLESTKIRLRFCLPLWFFLAVLYISASKIHPFQGKCPQNATCKVFIRCNPGYELSEDGKSCNVKVSIIEQIQSVCKFEIQALKQQLGDAKCLDNISNPALPYKQVSQLIDSITKTVDMKLSAEISQKIRNFLNNETNQAQFNFAIQTGKVIPLKQKHSFRCWLILSSRTSQFKVIGVIFTLLCILAGWSYIVFKRQKKIKQIYEYLKRKVLEENKVNITLLNDQIKLDFGAIDQNMWIKIDQERQKDGKIGYFEDEFLFWKLM